MVRDLPEPHIRLMFGVMIYRAGLISERALQREAVAAFGDAGNEIVRLILRGSPAVWSDDLDLALSDGR